MKLIEKEPEYLIQFEENLSNPNKPNIGLFVSQKLIKIAAIGLLIAVIAVIAEIISFIF